MAATDYTRSLSLGHTGTMSLQWGFVKIGQSQTRRLCCLERSFSRRFHLLPTKNGPGPGQSKYSDRESGTLASRRVACGRRDAFLFAYSRIQTGERIMKTLGTGLSPSHASKYLKIEEFNVTIKRQSNSLYKKLKKINQNLIFPIFVQNPFVSKNFLIKLILNILHIYIYISVENMKQIVSCFQWA